MSNEEKIELENEEENIITLVSDDGEEVDFIEIAGIAYKDDFYLILQPAELPEGMSEDEALVFKVTLNEDGSNGFDIETDDEIIDAVFEEYNKLLAEEEDQ